MPWSEAQCDSQQEPQNKQPLSTCAGLVASCACCSVIPVPIAPLVGFVAALLTLSFEELLARFQIDDAVGAAPWESNRQQEIPSGLSDFRSSGGEPRLPALSQIFFRSLLTAQAALGERWQSLSSQISTAAIITTIPVSSLGAAMQLGAFWACRRDRQRITLPVSCSKFYHHVLGSLKVCCCVIVSLLWLGTSWHLRIPSWRSSPRQRSQGRNHRETASLLVCPQLREQASEYARAVTNTSLTTG